jgi:hypothetical protein
MGVAAIVTLEAPVAGHVNVVDGSLPPGTTRQGPPAELAELIVTAGEKTTVTHTPLPPAVFTSIEKLPATPTAGLDGGRIPVTERSGRVWPASAPVSDSVAGTPSRRIRRNQPESIFRLPFSRSAIPQTDTLLLTGPVSAEPLNNFPVSRPATGLEGQRA